MKLRDHIEALIAHELCGGTNEIDDGCPDGKGGSCGYKTRCPGPHTVIDKGDGTKLYADKGPPADVLIMYLRRAGALPSEWRIE